MRKKILLNNQKQKPNFICTEEEDYEEQNNDSKEIKI